MSLVADLSGKRALITGASSDGFGAYFAHILSAAGAHVVVAARRLERLHDLVRDIEAKGGRATALEMDVTKSESVRDSVAAAGALDILVNNAGIERAAALLDQTEENYDAVMDTNLKGVWTVATEVARSMRDRGKGGSIINIASIAGFGTMAWGAPYCISKAGVVHLTKQMALELARFQIRVNAIAPGFFETDINRHFLETDAGKSLIKRIPMRRTGEMSDIDGALLLLASEASAFMTGSIITVDGGHVLNPL
jgi:NAD(P)-dependent dehydrogenase (short-subunit alcohol dehydrogenase family)